MTASPRAFTITYDTYAIGATSARMIDSSDSPVRIDQDEEKWSLEWDWILTSATAAAFATDVAAAEDAFAKPYQRLQVVLGGSTQYDFNPASGTNTGFSATPVITKRGDQRTDTGISRKYTCRVEVEIPADKLGSADGQMGRRRSRVDIEEDEVGRRTVTINGTYTAITGNTSRAQFYAQIAAFSSAVLTAVDPNGTFEPIGQPRAEFDDIAQGADFGKILEFTRVFREVTSNQSSSTLDDATLVNQSLTITVSNVALANPGVVGIGLRATLIRRITVSYSTGVVIPASGSPGAERVSIATLTSKWANTIRPFLIAQANLVAASAGVIIEEIPTYDLPNSRIDAVLVMEAVGGAILERELTVRDDDTTGEALLPLVAVSALAHSKYQGNRVLIRTITERLLLQGIVGGDPFGAGFPQISNPTNAIVRRKSSEVKPQQRGVLSAGSGLILTTEVTRTIEYQFFEEIASGGAGANRIAGGPPGLISGLPQSPAGASVPGTNLDDVVGFRSARGA